ncbi:Uncharacterized protein QTN25_009469 [Entamoeba marina]
MISLVCIDVDNTLLDTSHPDELFIHQDNVQTIKEAMDNGIHVCLATGRMLKSAAIVAKRVGLENEHIISYNGAIISKGNDTIHQSLLEGESFKTIIDVIQKNGMYAHFYVGDNYYIDKANEITPIYEQKTCVKASIIGNGVYHLERATKVLVLTKTKEEKIQFLPKFNGIDDVFITESSDTFIEITSKTATKGEAVKKLASILNIELKKFGYGVAMGNADCRIKEGRIITDVCRNAGVAKAIQKYCFNKND